jgi:hypothetical protein
MHEKEYKMPYYFSIRIKILSTSTQEPIVRTIEDLVATTQEPIIRENKMHCYFSTRTNNKKISN